MGIVHADRSFGGMAAEAQLVSMTTFTDVTEDGIMPGD
jgi:hypothetical protein